MQHPDERYMRRALSLSLNGLGQVAPNPMVGCVIVHENRIIGEGFHRQFGGPHAEVHAIESVAEADRHLLMASTLYVTLEPCSHFGKTPPCSSLILSKKIPQVITATFDPNPLVAGSGIRHLQSAGCRVVTGVLEDEAKELNMRFFTSIIKGRPYIILKWAQTTDGKTGINNQTISISSAYSRTLTHKWRSEESAIMCGTETALVDNPRLDARYWNQHHPIRIVMDQHLRLPATLHLMDQSIPTIVITARQRESVPGLEYVTIDFSSEIIGQILQCLHQRQIQSVFVEGGQRLIQSFIESGYWDEARVFISPMILGKGLDAPQLNVQPVVREQSGVDQLYVFKNTL